jgi:hypothetical protein
VKQPCPLSPHRNRACITPTIIVFLFPIVAYCGTYSPKTGSAPNTTEVSEEELALVPAKGPYFVCDDRVIEDRWKIERFVVQLKRYADNPIIVADYPWEGSGPNVTCALYDPKDEIFKIWYSVFSKKAYENGLPYSYNTCYAESRDGLKWEKPLLGLFDYEGSKENNIIKMGWEKTGFGDIEFNPKEHSSDARFVAIHNDCGGVYVSTSADGKSFDCSFEDSAVWYHSDTHNNIVYDEIRDRWLMYVRPRAYAGEGLKNVVRRRVAVKESKNLDFWTHERTILVPQEDDPDYFYSMTVFRLGDLFFGSLQIYETVHHHLYLELAWSEDGLRWNRLPKSAQRMLLNVGEEGSWDGGMVSIIEKPILVGDEMRFYYGGTNAAHNSWGETASGLATTKRDRLIGARSIPGNGSRLLTRPIPITGDLAINARATGEIRVEVRSSIRDEPIEGWTLDDCTPITGDKVYAPVRWGGKSLRNLKDQVVRLRFHLSDASLYSFDLIE